MKLTTVNAGDLWEAAGRSLFLILEVIFQGPDAFQDRFRYIEFGTRRVSLEESHLTMRLYVDFWKRVT